MQRAQVQVLLVVIVFDEYSCAKKRFLPSAGGGFYYEWGFLRGSDNEFKIDATDVESVADESSDGVLGEIITKCLIRFRAWSVGGTEGFVIVCWFGRLCWRVSELTVTVTKQKTLHCLTQRGSTAQSHHGPGSCDCLFSHKEAIIILNTNNFSSYNDLIIAQISDSITEAKHNYNLNQNFLVIC